MGVVLTNKNKEVHIGYISFGLIRQAVVKSYSESLGQLYEKMYSLRDDITISDDEYKMFETSLPEHLLEFLYHSDCEGYFKDENVKGIYKELIKLKPSFKNESLKQKYIETLDLFKDGERIDLY